MRPSAAWRVTNKHTAGRKTSVRTKMVRATYSSGIIDLQ
jgi:hypothetical protein